MSAFNAARDLAVNLGPFAVGRASPAGEAIIAQAEREVDAIEPETFWDRVARIERDHNISPAEAVRVASAEERVEAAKAARHRTTEPAALAEGHHSIGDDHHDQTS